MRDGNLYNGSKVYCSYEEIGQPRPTLPYGSNDIPIKYIPEVSEQPFKDYVFYAADGTHLIYITAKVLSSPLLTYLKYYYQVRFLSADTILNIPYHPYAISLFAKSLVKNNAILQNTLSSEKVYSIISKWKNKADAIPDKTIAAGTSCSYNISPYIIEPEIFSENSIVKVRSDSVFVHDTLFAIYHQSKNLRAPTLEGNSKGSFHYYINTPSNILIAEILVMRLRANILLWPAGIKEPLAIYTPEREEKRIISVATRVIRDYLRQSLASTNNK